MQKRKSIVTNSRGSVLVGSVAVAVLIAIAGIGFLQISTTGLNNELQALENEQAFQAAESGLLMAADWLSKNPYDPITGWTQIGSTTLPFNDNTVTIKGLKVSVRVTPVGGTTGNPVRIVSKAYNGATLDASTFRTSIQVSNVAVRSPCEYTTFYNDYIGDIDSWAGWKAMKFHGRFHMNNFYGKLYSGSGPDEVFADQTVFSDGLFTIAKNPVADGNVINYGRSTVSGNNYNYGIDALWSNPTPTRLDKVIQGPFVAGVDQIDVPYVYTDGQILSSDISITKIVLTQSTQEQGSRYYSYRPTLKFFIDNGVPKVTYSYTYGASNRDTSVTFPYSSNTVFISKTHINVYGKVRGKVSLASYPQKDICPVGDLYVEGYDPTNPTATIDKSNDNVIGLISGKTIRYDHEYLPLYNNGVDIYKDVRDNITGTDGSGNKIMNVTAAMLALWDGKDAGGNVVYDEEGVPWMGSEHVDYTTNDSYGYNIVFDFGIKIAGNQIMRGYRAVRTVSGSSIASGLGHEYSVIPDDRLIKSTVQPPGFPLLKTVNGQWILLMAGWVQQNNYSANW